MTRLASRAALLGAAALLLGSCGQSGGKAASSQPAASSATATASAAPAAAADAVVSSAAVSALPPVAAAPAAAEPVRIAERRREPTAAELLRDDPAYQARERRLEALYGNARDRDPTGQVEREHAAALAERRVCADRACLDAWFRRREAALRQYVEN